MMLGGLMQSVIFFLLIFYSEIFFSNHWDYDCDDLSHVDERDDDSRESRSTHEDHLDLLL